MRKHTQKQMLDIISTLTEATDGIKRLLLNNDVPTLLNFLSDCQECAYQLGTYIEHIKGEGTVTVGLLEDYCDLLHQISLGATNENHKPGFVRQLRKLLVSVENSIRAEFRPDRIEVAFFPYKAAMWDSLESVYLTAKNDPQCDAYVIPIPYFDRLPDGELGQMHYEGGEYPANIPVTDWREYDVEARHPDIIFTYSLYDSGNFITSIHPDFYCERLKNFTDLLVYVPYFVCVDDVQEHFCVFPGTRFAEKVIVQSEKVRQTYIRVFKEYERENDCKGMFGKPEDKFVALGSPKLDKVLSTKREDCVLPDEWSRLIGGKKAILYNTTIDAILQGDGQYLKKIRSVLDTFRERNDVVLWWRPHPLNEATYQSMRPDLLDKYRQIIAEYRREGRGIYDDSTDVHRAIAWSDAYYGDWSSVVAMYQITGKPVMIQSFYFLPELARKDALIFECCVDMDDYIYFPAFYWNALFRMDKQTWKAEYLGSFPGEKSDGVQLFRSVALLMGKLYFSPYSASGVGIYDIAASEFSVIPVADPTVKNVPNYTPYCKFNSVAASSGSLWFFPATYPGIMRLDAESGVITYLTDWAEHYDKAQDDTASWYCGVSVAEYRGRLYAPCFSANAIVMADTASGKIDILNTGGAAHHFCLCREGNNLWLVPPLKAEECGYVTKYCLDTLKTEQLPLPESGALDPLSDHTSLFASIVPSGGKVWAFPSYWSEAVCIDPDTGVAAVADAFMPELEFNTIPRNTTLKCYAAAWECAGKLFAVGARSRQIIEYDTATSERDEHTITADIDDALRSAFLKSIDACGDIDSFIYTDSAIWCTDYIIDLVLNGGHDREKQTRLAAERFLASGENAGEKTWKYCKNTVLEDRI